MMNFPNSAPLPLPTWNQQTYAFQISENKMFGTWQATLFVCCYCQIIYFKILNNSQYLESLMNASTKCIAWDQAPQLGKR